MPRSTSVLLMLNYPCRFSVEVLHLMTLYKLSPKNIPQICHYKLIPHKRRGVKSRLNVMNPLLFVRTNY